MIVAGEKMVPLCCAPQEAGKAETQLGWDWKVGIEGQKEIPRQQARIAADMKAA